MEVTFIALECADPCVLTAQRSGAVCVGVGAVGHPPIWTIVLEAGTKSGSPM